MIEPRVQRKLEKFLDAQLRNMPWEGSDRFCEGDTDLVTAGTMLTITFPIEHLWSVKLVKFYAEAIRGLEYEWIINNQSYSMSEGEFYLGKTMIADIVLIIANPTTVNEYVPYRIEGWADKIGKEG